MADEYLDEQDVAVASAISGSSADYSYLDTPTWEYDDEARCREHYEHDCPLCKDKFGSED